MQFIYDNLIAVIVSMTLAVSLLSQHTNVRQETLERQSVYDAKVKALVLAEWLEDDVVTLGARFGRSRDRFEVTTETVNGQPLTTRFEYYHYENRIAADLVERVEVRYSIVEDGNVFAGLDADGDEIRVPLYRLVRSRRSGHYRLDADGGGDWVGAEPAWVVPPGYTSPHGLSRFLIEPLDSDSRPVTDPQEADYMRLHFAIVPTLFPLDRARLIPSTGLFWSTTVEIRPF